MIVFVWLGGCATADYDLIYPTDTPTGITSFEQTVEHGDLRLALYWSVPPATAPRPTVLIQPGIEEDANDLRAITWDLAQRGYVAVAVEHERRIHGTFEHVVLPLRTAEEFTVALDVVRANPAVDRQRLALLGFSLGGTYSLLAAAHDPSVRAAIAYYPITNFPTWVKTHEKSWGWRMVFRAARWRYIAETPENNDVRHRELLQRSSVMAVADRIQAPTLLIHGEKDRIVPVAESQTLNTFLRERHLATELEIVPGVGHSFNFIDRQPAEDTWALTLGWLVRYLGPPPVAAATRATTQAPSWHR